MPKDDAQAVTWYRRGAEQGHVVAQYNLGERYYDGKGVPKDEEQAAAWYRKAAEQGHARAQNNLGVMYNCGWGVPEHHPQAVAWFRKAAEQDLQPRSRTSARCMPMGEACRWTTSRPKLGSTRLTSRDMRTRSNRPA